MTRLAQISVFFVLLLSLAFCAYLYPGPDGTTDTLLKSATSSSAGINRPEVERANAVLASAKGRAEIADGVRFAWLVNVGIVLLGGGASALYLYASRRSRALRWASVFALGLLVVLLLAVIVPDRGGVFGFIPFQIDNISRLLRASATPFAIAEVHRTVTLLIALVAFVVTVTASTREPKI